MKTDPFWSAGVAAYWSEGAKSGEIIFANSDARLVRLFMAWTRRYLRADAERFTARLHVHSGQDEPAIKAYWSEVTGIPVARFYKTYVKPESTGHRKNQLHMGTIAVRMTHSGKDLQRVLGWIDGLEFAP